MHRPQSKLLAPAAVLGLAAVLALACSTASRTEDEKFRMMSMDDVERALGTQGFHVFDVNVPEIFEKHHLPGALHVKGAALASLLPQDRSARLLFYCTSPS